MIDIRPVSDLRNHFSEIEAAVNEGRPIFLTKNGYGTMVVMNLAQYAALTEGTEQKLDEADRLATMALQKKSETVQSIPTLQANYDKYCAAVAKLEDSVKKLRDNLAKWKNEAKMLKARSKVSEATANGIDSSDTIAMLERMKEKVDQQEALAESYLDIANAEVGVDNEIDSALESTGGSLEASSALAALKARMSAQNAIESSVESSKAIADASVSELDQLKQKMAEPQAAQQADVAEAQQQADQSAL